MCSPSCLPVSRRRVSSNRKHGSSLWAQQSRETVYGVIRQGFCGCQFRRSLQLQFHILARSWNPRILSQPSQHTSPGLSSIDDRIPRLTQILVWSLRCGINRTKDDFIGFVVLRCIPCSAGMSWKISNPPASFPVSPPSAARWSRSARRSRRSCTPMPGPRLSRSPAGHSSPWVIRRWTSRSMLSSSCARTGRS